MAAAPSYASTPLAWCGVTPGTADTSWTAPTHVTTLGTAGSSGSKISQIDVVQAGNTIATGVVNIFLYDGTTYHLHESVAITAGTISTTVAATKSTFSYDNLVLPSTAWTMAVTTTVSGNTGIIAVNAYGASL